jgi:hypothetical protein
MQPRRMIASAIVCFWQIVLQNDFERAMKQY